MDSTPAPQVEEFRVLNKQPEAMHSSQRNTTLDFIRSIVVVYSTVVYVAMLPAT